MMTTFEFMASAFYIMAGVVCCAVAILVVFGVIAGIRKSLTRQNKRERDD